ncbi:MAG: RNA methyltransferase [Lachnospiraceae bacterium]|nr:RNA methyltransferase [Lachnospiraceae bacterium]MDN4744826.1 RNA methyltransferase [Lachnospiraceae bacterium C1.1]
MISSYTNARLNGVRSLRDRSKARREKDAFVVEGIRAYKEIPEEDLLETYVSESFHKRYPSIKGEIVKEEVFKKLSDTTSPQGVLAVVRQKHYKLADLIKAENGLFLVLEGIQDPGNLGTMLRSGEGAGVTALIMDRKTADIYSPKVVRSTMGTIFRVPFIYTDDLRSTVEEMKKAGVRFYAAHLKGSKNYCDIEYAPKTAFMIGNEGNGLSDELTAMADERLLIPMKGKVESLNASVSASILMYKYAEKNYG